MAGYRIKQMCFTVSLLHILALTLTDGCQPTSVTVDLLSGTAFYLSMTTGMPDIFTYELFAYISMDPEDKGFVTKYYSAEKVEVEVIDLNKSIIAISDPSKKWYICRTHGGFMDEIEFDDIENIYRTCKWKVDPKSRLITAAGGPWDLELFKLRYPDAIFQLKETVQFPPKYKDPICVEPRKYFTNRALEKFKRGRDAYYQLQEIKEMIKRKMSNDSEYILSLINEFENNDFKLELLQWDAEALKRIKRPIYCGISGRAFTKNSSDLNRELQELREKGNSILRELQAIFTKSNSADIQNTTNDGEMLSFSEIFQKADLLREDKNIDHTFHLIYLYIRGKGFEITPAIEKHAIEMALDEEVLRGRDQQILKDLPCLVDYFVQINAYARETFYLKKAIDSYRFSD